MRIFLAHSPARLALGAALALTAAGCGWARHATVATVEGLVENFRDDLLFRQREILFGAPAPARTAPINLSYQRGQDARAAGDHEGALAAFTAYEIEEPNDEHTRAARLFQAEALLALGRPEEACVPLAEVWNDRYARRDQGARVGALLGRALADLGRHEDALDVLTQATRRWPEEYRDRPDLYLLRGELARRRGREAEAAQSFQFVIARWPDGDDAVRARAALATADGTP